MMSLRHEKEKSMKAKQPKPGKRARDDKPQLSLVIEQDPHTLREKTVTKLREALIAGYFEPGEQLVERDISARTDVSRTSLREALRHLETEGLVESRKGEGVFVKSLSPQDVRDIYELRMALDAEAAENFSERASKESRLRLKALTLQWNKIKFGDVEQVLAANNEFFSALYEGAGNKLSQEIMRSLQSRISLLRAITSRSSNKSRFQEGLALTRELVCEIEKGNSKKAAMLARQYAARSLEFALAILSHTEPPSDEDLPSSSKWDVEK
jgi:GntR family transcriptional regulator, trigonelline degradation regulator